MIKYMPISLLTLLSTEFKKAMHNGLHQHLHHHTGYGRAWI